MLNLIERTKGAVAALNQANYNRVKIMMGDTDDGVPEQTTPTKKEAVRVPWINPQDKRVNMLETVKCF